MIKNLKDNNDFLFVGYREWAKNVHSRLKLKMTIVDSNKELINLLSKNSYEHIFLVGWSSIIPDYILQKSNFYCVHPSELPYYRGGSPIQHQILDGLKSSYVTLFKIEGELDSGPIFSKQQISLEGEINDVLTNIANASTILINNFIDAYINNNLIFTPQNEEQKTLFKRRKPEESEITINEIENNSAEFIYNKIRCLQDPYPNAFLTCKDGKKVYILKAKL